MSNAAECYSRALYEHFSLLGTWMPNARLALGDVGVWDRGIFRRLTSLEELGIDTKIRTGTTPANLSFTSATTLAVRPSLSAGLAPALAVGQAHIDITFANHGGFVFQAIDCYQDELDDRVGLAKNILGYVRTGEWERNWVLVDSILRAGSATILISNSSTASIGLHVEGPVEVSSLAKLKAGFSVTSESGNIARFISQSGLVPLFTLGRIKPSLLQRLLGAPGETMRFGGAGDGSLALAESDLFEVVRPDEPG